MDAERTGWQNAPLSPPGCVALPQATKEKSEGELGLHGILLAITSDDAMSGCICPGHLSTDASEKMRAACSCLLAASAMIDAPAKTWLPVQCARRAGVTTVCDRDLSL